MPTTSATELLQSAIQSQHIRLGSLPFFQAAASNRLDGTSYLGLLQGMAPPHEALEQLVAANAVPVLQAIWDLHMCKLSLIQHDLAALQRPPEQSIKPALLRGHVFAEQIRIRALRDPITLVGTLFALNLWNLGGTALSQQIAHSCHVANPHALHYLNSYDSWGQAHWHEFAFRINAQLSDSACLPRTIDAAQEAFDAIERIIDVLHPLNTSTFRDLSTSLNPIAGNHQIADDLYEIQAAMRADEITWRQFPYIEWRYGKRGREYGWSDSAWLVSLCEMNSEKIRQQIVWFGSLLSNRGMPQWLVEQHLLALYQEVVKAHPDKQADYAKLQGAAEILRTQRLAQIDEETFWSLARAFDQQVGPEWNARLPGTGEILVSAVADEKAGIVNAVASLEGWLTDPDRFPPSWISAVQLTIRHAREAVYKA